MCSLHSTCYDLLFPICACFWIGDPIQANLPKEIADYLNKMGARIPNVKPGKATIEYLTKIQASTRFWGTHLPLQVIYLMNNYNLELYLFLFFLEWVDPAGGLLLSVLATTSTILDHYLRRINEGFAIGFTSVLIIVSANWHLMIMYYSLGFVILDCLMMELHHGGMTEKQKLLKDAVIV